MKPGLLIQGIVELLVQWTIMKLEGQNVPLCNQYALGNNYLQTSNISFTLGNPTVDHSDVVRACRRCSNYSFLTIITYVYNTDFFIWLCTFGLQWPQQRLPEVYSHHLPWEPANEGWGFAVRSSNIDSDWLAAQLPASQKIVLDNSL